MESVTHPTNLTQHGLSSGNNNRQQEARFGIPLGYTGTGTVS